MRTDTKLLTWNYYACMFCSTLADLAKTQLRKIKAQYEAHYEAQYEAHLSVV